LKVGEIMLTVTAEDFFNLKVGEITLTVTAGDFFNECVLC